MNTDEITNKTKQIHDLLDRRRLHQALDMIINECVVNKCWRIGDDARQLAGDYQLMCERLAAGGPDPSRSAMHRSLLERAYILADRLKRELLAPWRPKLYYTVLNTSEKTLLERLEDASADSKTTSLFEQIASGGTISTESEAESVNQTTEMFYATWVAYPMDNATRRALSDYLLSSPVDESSRLLSALLLGELEFHDPARVSVMADVYLQSDEDTLRAQALVAILMALYKYRHRDVDPRLAEQLATMAEMPGWREHLTTAFIELLRTRDTERISRKMADEIIPAMMSLRPEIMRKLNEIDPESIDPSNPEGLESNPEWAEMLAKSGLEDKLKQMSEIQLDGGDVFMSTFSHLKRFPFFHDVVNWFTLFDPANKAVEHALDGNTATAEALGSAPFMCDSDKYSLAFSMSMLPDEQRKLVFSQMEAQRLNMYEAAQSLGTDNFKSQSSRHLQNLNRFLKLFRRKGEFYDPFIQGINMLEVPVVRQYLDEAIIALAAEFFFKIEAWDEAARAFMTLKDDAVTSQKIGYCYEKLGRLSDAYEHYRRAENLSTPSRWLLKRLQAVARRLGNTRDALFYATRMAELDTDDMSTAMTLAYAQLESGQTEQAIKTLHRAEFIDETSSRPWRALAWALFLTRDFQGAERYYDRIVVNNPTPNDFFNYAHLKLATGNTDDAIKLYRRSLVGNDDAEAFASRLDTDRQALASAGVDTDILPVIVDTVIFNSK